MYKGLAFGFASSGAPMIYATNFHAGRIDVFDGNYTAVSLGDTNGGPPTITPGNITENFQSRWLSTVRGRGGPAAQAGEEERAAVE